MINASTGLISLIGHPVEHSLSPQMHNYIYNHMGLNYVYMAFDVQPVDVGESIKGFKALKVKGFNVTVPHKEAVMPFLDHIDPMAELVGAVNTVVSRDGMLIGYNTDGVGFMRSLEYRGVDVKNKKALILGAGGACKAVAAALAMRGVQRITIANRTLQKAEAVAASINHHIAAIAYAISLDDIMQLERPDILVNTTPLGMWPYTDGCPIPDGYDLSGIELVYDLIYNPEQTLLMKKAVDSGCQAMNGLDMLIWQAIEAIRIWFDVDVPYGLAMQALKRGE